MRYFSYADERLESFTGDRALLDAVEVVPPGRSAPRRVQAALLATGRSGCLLSACGVVRAFQTPGGLPGAIAGTRLVTTYGYRYEDFTRVPRLPPPLSTPLLAGKRRALRTAARFVLRRSAAAIATTRAGAEEARRLGAPHVELIPNGVDVELFSPPGGEAEFDVACVGRLEPLKDVGTLLAAAARAGGGLRLCVVGAGPERPALEAASSRLGLDVAFAGTLPNREVARLLGRSRCFVLPSRAEGHSKALVEAMACGLPCVAADIEANREFPDEAVLRFPAGDAEALAALLGAVLDDERVRSSLGAAARALAVEWFDLRRLVDREAAFLAAVASR